MGNISSVGLVLSKPASDNLTELMNDNTIEGDKSLFANADKRFTDEKSGATAYYWKEVWWEDSSPAVMFMLSFIESLSYEDFGFLRIGEEMWDEEDYGGMIGFEPFGMGIERKIVWDCENQ